MFSKLPPIWSINCCSMNNDAALMSLIIAMVLISFQFHWFYIHLFRNSAEFLNVHGRLMILSILNIFTFSSLLCYFVIFIKHYTILYIVLYLYIIILFITLLFNLFYLFYIHFLLKNNLFSIYASILLQC